MGTILFPQDATLGATNLNADLVQSPDQQGLITSIADGIGRRDAPWVMSLSLTSTEALKLWLLY